MDIAKVASLLILLSATIGTATVSPIAAASEEKFGLCRIEYDVRNKADPEHHIDTSKISKQFTACTRNLSDCQRRGKSLAQAHENVYRNNPHAGVPDLSTIHVSNVKIEGHCNELQ